MLVWLTKFYLSFDACLPWRSGYCYSDEGNAIYTNLLLKRWPKTIAETMATATKFMKCSQLIWLATERKGKSDRWSLVFKRA